MAWDNTNTHLSATFGKLLEPGLRKIFFETYDEVPQQFSQIFHVKTSKKAKETDYGLGAFGAWGKRASGVSAVEYNTIPAGLERTYTHEEFLDGFAVERKFVDDEMYDVINKLPAALARAGRATVEMDAVSLFANGHLAGTAEDTDAYVIYDGKALFAEDHPLLGSESVVGVNKIYGALSDTTLKDGIECMRETPDEAGIIAQFIPDVLVVPRELEFLAIELTQSKLKAGTNNNDVNSLLGRLKVQVWDFLTSDVEWFLMDSKRHEANFFWRVKPEFKHDEDFDTLVAKYRGYMRYSYGVSDWRGLVGSTGAAEPEG